MPLPQSWVDELFSRLNLRYGAAFLDQWRGGNINAVKADWCNVLDGFEKHPDSIRYALDNLPDRPVNAIGFRQLCRSSPLPEFKALPPPKADADLVAKVQGEIARAIKAPPRPAGNPAQVVIDGICQRLQRANVTPSRSQRAFVSTCVRMLGPTDPRRDLLVRLGFSDVEPTARVEGAAA